jgi:HlyD family secretion protein
MNYEARLSPADAQPAGDMSWFDDAAARDQRRRRRRAIIIGVVILALVLAAAWYAFAGNGEEGSEAAPAAAAAAPAAGGAEGGTGQAPRVTVITPGRELVETVVTATGNLAARREMPVGVAGEGGQVVRVFVEPGQWVRAGQVLATVDRAVQVQQLAQLDASIRVAQADASLAESELNRAQALVARGFISRADIERRTAQRDSAVARVRQRLAWSLRAVSNRAR